MIREANDFLAESELTYELLRQHASDELSEQSAFKCWSFNDIVRHLHVWNQMALLSLNDTAQFQLEFEKIATALLSGHSYPEAERQWLGEQAGQELLQQWHGEFHKLADAFADSDPEQRVPWAGPPMSARSSITARLMETWAHAQAIYDELGKVRTNGEHIKSIAELGVRTYRWTFANRELEVPLPKPFVSLRSPAGEQWCWNEERDDERIEGDAGEFCQVVTQVRNVADTRLQVTGSNAKRWMAIAQCFAGGAEDPPAPGERRTR